MQPGRGTLGQGAWVEALRELQLPLWPVLPKCIPERNVRGNRIAPILPVRRWASGHDMCGRRLRLRDDLVRLTRHLIDHAAHGAPRPVPTDEP